MDAGNLAGTVDQGMFKGVAVVIDDGVEQGEQDILTIIDSIKQGGGHPVVLSKLPSGQDDLDNFANVSFFIMDWHLHGLPADVKIPETLRDQVVKDNLAFLKRLSKHRHAPVFIFTNEDPDVVMEALSSDPDLHFNGDESHILVKRKTEVGREVYKVLNEWASDVPSVIALKAWERNHTQALNALFVDFYNRSSLWPVMLWHSYTLDGVAPAEELGRLITRLVASRMMPPDINLESFSSRVEQAQQQDGERYRKALIQVLEGERIVPHNRLDPNNAAPGDFYEETVNGVVKYRLNVRAECDCVVRSGNRNPKLYLLKGKVLQGEDLTNVINSSLGNLVEKDNEAIVYAMYKGQTISFSFRDVTVENWNQWKSSRIGRLLPPFSTRIIQRYAAYGQRPGLPRIPPALLSEIPNIGEASSANGTAETCEI